MIPVDSASGKSLSVAHAAAQESAVLIGSVLTLLRPLSSQYGGDIVQALERARNSALLAAQRVCDAGVAL